MKTQDTRDMKAAMTATQDKPLKRKTKRGVGAPAAIVIMFEPQKKR